MADKRKCKAKFFEKVDGSWKESSGYGEFHCWGSELVESEEPLTFTVAIVELSDGRIVTTVPENVRFLDR